MSGRASMPRPPIYRRLSVVNSPNSPISGRNPGGELTAPIKRRYSAVFRRQPRSRVQDARGFFFVCIVLVFCFGCGYGLFFCLCCLALFFWSAFDCVILLFSVCLLLAFSSCFAACCICLSVLVTFPASSAWRREISDGP